MGRFSNEGMLEVMKMSYQETITKVAEDPEQLEQVYHAAIQAGESDAFQQAIEDRHRTTPDNLLYGAWYYRLQATAVQAKGVAIAWGWVVPLALLNGLLFWWLSDEQFMTEIVGTDPALTREFLPVIFLLAAPISAVFVLIYLTAAGRKPWGLSALIGIVLLAFGGYVLLIYPQTGIGPLSVGFVIAGGLKTDEHEPSEDVFGEPNEEMISIGF